MALPCENSPSGLTDPRIASLFSASLADVGRLPCCESGLCPIQNFLVFGLNLNTFYRTSDSRAWMTYRREHIHNTNPADLNRTQHYAVDSRGRQVTTYDAAAWEVAVGNKPAPPAFTAEAGPVISTSRNYTIYDYWSDQMTVDTAEAICLADYGAYSWANVTEETTTGGSGAWNGLHWPGDIVESWNGPRPWPVEVYYHDVKNPGRFLMAPPAQQTGALYPGRYQYQTPSADENYSPRDVYCRSAGHVRHVNGVAIVRGRIQGNGIVCEVTRIPVDAAQAALGHTEWPVTCLEHPAPADGSPNVVYAEPVMLPFASATPSPTQGSFTGLFDFPVRYFPYNTWQWVIAQPRCATRQGAVSGTGWEWNPAFL